MKQINVLLVDDEPKVLNGLRMRLALESDISVVGQASDGAAAIALAGQLAPDVVIMDVNLPVLDGIAATREITNRAPRAAVVILSLQDDLPTVERALAAGAVAFIAKHRADGDLITAIRMAASSKGGALGR